MSEIKVTDALALFVADSGIRTIFGVTGGAAVHILDSFNRTGLTTTVYNHHEQASAFAADAYGRAAGIGACVTTTGPGVSNAMTGLLTAWQDSTPVIFISGQSRLNNLGLGFPVRQGGTQHLNVEGIVKNLCKQFVLIKDELELPESYLNLLKIATSGRCGPVWIDIPLDIQLKTIPLKIVSEFRVKIKTYIQNKKIQEQNLDEQLEIVLAEITASKKPLFIFGRGVSQISTIELNKLLKIYNFPIVTTWGAVNSTVEQNDNFVGRIGISGHRSANKIAAESDLLIIVGSRLNQSTSGNELASFAKNAKIICVDIDEIELDYLSSRRRVTRILSDGSHFIKMLNMVKGFEVSKVNNWTQRAVKLKKFNEQEYKNLEKNKKFMNQYDFLKVIDCYSSGNNFAIIIDGGGTLVYSSMQILKSKEIRQIYIPSASAPMGTGLPFLEGVLESNRYDFGILLIGDGSIMFNLQELQTIKTNNYPCLIVILNNEGYRSIRSTQSQFLDSNFLGSLNGNEIDFPSFKKISKAFGFTYRKVKNINQLEKLLRSGEFKKTSIICEAMIDPSQDIFPRVGFEKQLDGSFRPATLDNMYPHLSEFK